MFIDPSGDPFGERSLALSLYGDPFAEMVG
jgi:hypothetical protein